MTGDQQRDVRLDVVRGLAALWVMLFHAWQYGTPSGPVPTALPAWLPYQIMAVGWAGVPLFFVLSGFLLTSLSIQRPARSATSFWRRRVARILPAYWTQCLILTLMLAVGVRLAGAQATSIEQIPAQALMLYNLHPDGARPWMAPWWSLPVEAGFYALFPLLIRAAHRAWIWILILLALGACCIRWLPSQLWPDSRWPLIVAMHLPGQLDLFLAGMLVALWMHRRPTTMPPGLARWIWPFGSLVALGWVLLPAWLGAPAPRFVAIDPLWAGWNVVFGLWIGLMCWGGMTLDRSGIAASGAARSLAWVGRTSYSLYLWHLPWVIVCAGLAAQWLSHPLRGALVFAIALAPSLATAWVSWRFVEQPFLRHRPARASLPAA